MYISVFFILKMRYIYLAVCSKDNTCISAVIQTALGYLLEFLTISTLKLACAVVSCSFLLFLSRPHSYGRTPLTIPGSWGLAAAAAVCAGAASPAVLRKGTTGRARHLIPVPWDCAAHDHLATARWGPGARLCGGRSGHHGLRSGIRGGRNISAVGSQKDGSDISWLIVNGQVNRVDR